MNEIKFKALSNGKLYQCHACNFETLNALVDVEGSHSPQWCRIEKFMEYTGLKDKNGREIYGKDIVNWENNVFEIRRDGLNSCWYGMPKYDNSIRGILSPMGFGKSHIIGNVWENPELMEVE